jgi:hypothetical protein
MLAERFPPRADRGHHDAGYRVLLGGHGTKAPMSQCSTKAGCSFKKAADAAEPAVQPNCRGIPTERRLRPPSLARIVPFFCNRQTPDIEPQSAFLFSDLRTLIDLGLLLCRLFLPDQQPRRA